MSDAFARLGSQAREEIELLHKLPASAFFLNTPRNHNICVDRLGQGCGLSLPLFGVVPRQHWQAVPLLRSRESIVPDSDPFASL